MIHQLETDYLVIGAGAMGMAFSDVIMTESNATIILVDKHDRPGGHWNVSYPFVRLHQPSSFYGVNSRKLGNDTKDATGWNQGLYELASGTEVVTYFEQVMQQQFLPTDRVRYFPMCEFQSAGTFSCLVSGKKYAVKVNRKTVDSTYMNVTVPAMSEPSFELEPEVTCVPLNDIPGLHSRGTRFEKYIVIGAGKTGMDAALWLLRNDVDPDHIIWIMPRDSWMLDRKNIQPGPDFMGSTLVGAANELEAIAQSESVEDLFARVNKCGQLLRMDEDIQPTMYRCATVTEMELKQLRRIAHIVRKGRVKRIEADKIILEKGMVETSLNNLHINCTADGLERRPVAPVFDGDQMTLQTVRTCQQVFSAAFIAHIELTYEDETQKNDLCTVVPHPNTDLDFLRTTLGHHLNQARWAQLPELQKWLQIARLDGFTRTDEEIAALPESAHEPLAKLMGNATQATERLQQLLAEIDRN